MSDRRSTCEENNLLIIEHDLGNASLEGHHGSNSDASSLTSSLSPDRDQINMITNQLKELNYGVIRLNDKIDTILQLNKMLMLNQMIPW